MTNRSMLLTRFWELLFCSLHLTRLCYWWGHECYCCDWQVYVADKVLSAIVLLIASDRSMLLMRPWVLLWLTCLCCWQGHDCCCSACCDWQVYVTDGAKRAAVVPVVTDRSMLLMGQESYCSAGCDWQVYVTDGAMRAIVQLVAADRSVLPTGSWELLFCHPLTTRSVSQWLRKSPFMMNV